MSPAAELQGRHLVTRGENKPGDTRDQLVTILSHWADLIH